MLDYKSLKAKKKDNFDKLATELKNHASGNRFKFDNEKEGFWQPTADKTKAGYATIRFMPASPVDEDPKNPGCALPWVLLYTHNFKGPGGWYIENCLTTLSTKENPVTDPAVEYGNKLWGPKQEARNQAAKDRVSGTPGNPGTKRKTNYISNIYIVDDPAVPENNGKTFYFNYGPKLFEFLNEAMNPSTPDQKRWDPFDLDTGANFKLRFRQVEGYRNYGRSEWENKGEPLFEDEDKTEALYNSLPSLKEQVDPSKFKTYNVLKKKLLRVIGEDDNSPVHSGTVEDQEVVAQTNEDTESFQGSTPPWDEQVKAAVTGTKTKVRLVEEPEVEDQEPVTEGVVTNVAFFESLRDK